MNSKEKGKTMDSRVLLPEGISASLENSTLILNGKKGELKKEFKSPFVNLEIDGKEVIFKSTKNTKKEKMLIGSFVAHLKSMIHGVIEGNKYVLKICSGHFPMNVSVNKEELVIKNFFGEKTPRVLKLKKGAEVTVEGDQITVESIDKAIAGQVSADIEQLTRRTGYDSRVFQDGCYITMKNDKPIK